jgi:prephenate dehydrogenase
MRVAIVGLGLIGGSLALALRERRAGWERIGHEVDPAVLKRAVDQGIVAAGDPHDADLVVLATPIPALPDLFAAYAGHRGVVTDVASTKETVLSWAHDAGLDLVGGHPMTGREQSGLAAADAGLFCGAPWALTRDDPLVLEMALAVGARPVVLDAARHDQLVAGVSHAAFAVSAAYVLALAGDDAWPEMAALAGPGYRDLSRLAGGDVELHAAIAATNRPALLRRLREVEASLARLHAHLEAGGDGMTRLLAEAKRVRDAWARDAARGSSPSWPRSGGAGG